MGIKEKCTLLNTRSWKEIREIALKLKPYDLAAAKKSVIDRIGGLTDHRSQDVCLICVRWVCPFGVKIRVADIYFSYAPEVSAMIWRNFAATQWLSGTRCWKVEIENDDALWQLHHQLHKHFAVLADLSFQDLSIVPCLTSARRKVPLPVFHIYQNLPMA